MALARHDPATLARFQDGERCLVWARSKSDGSLFQLPDGEAEALRTWAKEHLECFMPDCRDRRLTTVARRPRRRDGFRHHAGSGGHSAESEAHQQGKAALVSWVSQTLGGQGVTAVPERSTSDRKRIADVMVTWPDGRQVALEVQYAPLSVAHWQSRQESYREQGITVVWLLGHTGTHLRPARPRPWDDQDATGSIALNDLAGAMTDAGVPLLWINPVLAEGPTLATAAVTAEPDRNRREGYDDGHDDTRFEVPPRPGDTRATLATDLLSSCVLHPGGLWTPSLGHLEAAAVTLASVNGARRAQDDARAAAAAEAQALAMSVQARRSREERARQRQAWESSVLRQQVLERHDGRIPYLLTVQLGTEQSLLAPGEHWRAVVYRHLLYRRVGQRFTVRDVYRVLRREGVAGTADDHPGGLAGAVVSWLDHLDECGYVAVRRDRFENWRVDHIEVLGDLDAPPPRRPPTPVRGSVPPGPRPSPTHSGTSSQPSPPQHLAPTAPSAGVQATTPSGNVPLVASPTPPRSEPVARCRRCRLPLDPLLAHVGLHISC